MRCLFTCTADSYNVNELFASLKGRYEASIERGVIQIEIPTHFDTGNIFYFPFGCIICWGLSKEQEDLFIGEAKNFERQSLVTPVVDVFTYNSGESSKVVNGEIILANRNSLTLMAISHGLAQSVKIDAFEKRIQRTVDLTRHVPQEMATKGRVFLSRREIRRMMGELFIERNSINLHFDILDKPEFFWEYPEVEPLYYMIAHYLDIETRVEVLNQRLGVIHELFEMLGNELNHQHSSRLEWTIIILILIEVGIALMRDVFHWI